jgi:hypothetical protein
MRNVRQGAASVTLADGRVLVAGGIVFRRNGTPVPVRTAELYDPHTKRWSAAASLPAPLAAFSLTRLRDGRVLLAGGIDDRTHAPSARAYVFSPATKRWTSTASLRQARARQQAVLLRDGTVLVSGGYVGGFVDDITTAAETYDPRTGRWVPAGRMRHARAGAFAVALSDGRVLVAGGWSPGDDQQRSAELYRPASRSWVATRSMTYGRYGDHGTATRLKDGRVLVVGGYFENDYYSPWPNPFDRRREAFAEVFLPARNAWRVTARLAVPVQDAFTTTLLPTGRVLLAGGLARNDPLAVTQEFDPATGRWHRRNDLTAPLYGHVAALVAGGRVLVAGGALNTLGSATPGAPAMNRRTLLYGP